MQQVTLRWGSWYRDEDVALGVPSEWRVTVRGSVPRPVLSDEVIRSRFDAPIGTPRLRELARGRASVCILTDDLSRPTPAHRILPFVLEELRAAGIEEKDVLVLIAFGCHRQMTRTELAWKLGEETLGRVEVVCHDASDDLTFVGTTSFGTPLYLNRFLMECDLKIGLGGIYPHGGPAWGGGAKILLPGAAGLETNRHNHKLKSGGHNGPLDNEMRLDMEEAARMAGMDAIANVVVNGRREAIGLFVGDVVAAHRAGVAFARDVCAVPGPEDADVVIANVYPMDVSLNYAGKGMWPVTSAKDDATKIVIGLSPDGAGYHTLYRVGRAQWGNGQAIEDARFLLYSPLLGAPEVHRVFPNCAFFRVWEDLIERVAKRYDGRPVNAAVYPYASIQHHTD